MMVRPRSHATGENPFSRLQVADIGDVVASLYNVQVGVTARFAGGDIVPGLHAAVLGVAAAAQHPQLLGLGALPAPARLGSTTLLGLPPGIEDHSTFHR